MCESPIGDNLTVADVKTIQPRMNEEDIARMRRYSSKFNLGWLNDKVRICLTRSLENHCSMGSRLCKSFIVLQLICVLSQVVNAGIKMLEDLGKKASTGKILFELALPKLFMNNSYFVVFFGSMFVQGHIATDSLRIERIQRTEEESFASFAFFSFFLFILALFFLTFFFFCTYTFNLFYFYPILMINDYFILCVLRVK